MLLSWYAIFSFTLSAVPTNPAIKSPGMKTDAPNILPFGCLEIFMEAT